MAMLKLHDESSENPNLSMLNEIVKKEQMRVQLRSKNWPTELLSHPPPSTLLHSTIDQSLFFCVMGSHFGLGLFICFFYLFLSFLKSTNCYSFLLQLNIDYAAVLTRDSEFFFFWYMQFFFLLPFFSKYEQ